MNKSSLFMFSFFSIILVFGIMTYFPFSDSADLTDQGTEIEGSFIVNNNWTEKGMIDGLFTDQGIIYPDDSSSGNWSSYFISKSNIDLLDLSIESDPNEGNIDLFIKTWNNSEGSGDANNIIHNDINTVEYNNKIDLPNNSETFKIIIQLEETAGIGNDQPNVNSIDLTYINNFNRPGLGMNSQLFQLITLMFMIGTVLLSLLRSVD